MSDSVGTDSVEVLYVAECDIHNVIVHTIKKKSGQFVVDPRETTLKVGITIQRVIDTLAVLYAARTGKSHGRFENDLDLYPFSYFLNNYFLSGTESFVSATKNMTNTLVREMRQTASPGGHVFYAHFTRSSNEGDVEYFISAILNDELGAALSNSKDVVDNLHLDIKGFRLAGRVNLTGWKVGTEKYVSFLKGKGQDKVSDFFKSFIGCNNSIAAAVETGNLTKVLEEFASSKKMSDEEKSEFFRKAYVICKTYSDKDHPFEAEAFSNELWPTDPQELAAAISSSENNISDGFIPHKGSLNKLIKFSAKSKHWKLDFDRAALALGEIHYDPKKSELIIKNLPIDLIERLKGESPDGDDGDD
jgi:nucleoid-associated protein